jgi:hypothetical protein
MDFAMSKLFDSLHVLSAALPRAACAAVLVALAGCGGQSSLQPVGLIEPGAFFVAQNQIPGGVVTSSSIRVHDLADATHARVVSGDEVDILVNGEPKGRRAEVGDGDRVQLRAVMPGSLGAERTVIVELAGRRLDWTIVTLSDEPPDRFGFTDHHDIEPGSRAYSDYLAPSFFTEPAVLTVDGEGWWINTASGVFSEPVEISPGEIFQIRAEAPATGGEVRELRIRLGDRTETWTLATRQ